MRFGIEQFLEVRLIRHERIRYKTTGAFAARPTRVPAPDEDAPSLLDRTRDSRDPDIESACGLRATWTRPHTFHLILISGLIYSNIQEMVKETTAIGRRGSNPRFALDCGDRPRSRT